MSNASPQPQRPTEQPVAIWNAPLGIWENPQLDLFGQRAPYSATWWTSGMTRNGSAYPLPSSARLTLATEFSSSVIPLFRTPLASDAARGRESLQRVKARRGTIALSHQIIDLALHGPNGHHRDEETDTLWHLISQIFDAGDATPQPSHSGSESLDDQPRRPQG